MPTSYAMLPRNPAPELVPDKRLVWERSDSGHDRLRYPSYPPRSAAAILKDELGFPPSKPPPSADDKPPSLSGAEVATLNALRRGRATAPELNGLMRSASYTAKLAAVVARPLAAGRVARPAALQGGCYRDTPAYLPPPPAAPRAAVRLDELPTLTELEREPGRWPRVAFPADCWLLDDLMDYYAEALSKPEMDEKRAAFRAKFLECVPEPHRGGVGQEVLVHRLYERAFKVYQAEQTRKRNAPVPQLSQATLEGRLLAMPVGTLVKALRGNRYMGERPELRAAAQAVELRRESSIRTELDRAKAAEAAAPPTLKRKASEDVGPEGQTLDTHRKVYDFHKSGGKGQICKAPRWVKNRDDDDPFE